MNRVQFNGSGTTEAWLDAGGSNVANLLGALSLRGSKAGWNQLAAPDFLTYDIDAATAQAWVDNGLGGIALSTTDDGDSRSRYNFGQGAAGEAGAANITFLTAVPEPSSLVIVGMFGIATFIRRRR